MPSLGRPIWVGENDGVADFAFLHPDGRQQILRSRNADRWAGGRNARIVAERPCRYRGSGAESEVVALVLVIFHRLVEDVIVRQRSQRFGDFL
jgi:hypothetical protein